MDKLNWMIWQLTATGPVDTFKGVMGNILEQLAKAINAVQTPFMVAIAIVAGVTLLWRILSSDDPQEMPRAIRSALIMVGGAAVVLYLVPPLLIAIATMIGKTITL